MARSAVPFNVSPTVIIQFWPSGLFISRLIDKAGISNSTCRRPADFFTGDRDNTETAIGCILHDGDASGDIRSGFYEGDRIFQFRGS